ncbi:GntR family transcriptional regulator [Nesterenkonia ebinurensis]|uniref:GntR family transcriptional regulator n=1 Tax=Nesterenkonia ebinurensis TaxID=2608252 RepID=UPI00123D1B17|nr:GntR family transcriptional regulator [Nesterenkonia ebinurensis]
MTPAPKYERIAEELAERCASLPPGTRLPPEKILAEEFSVSRMTVRQALERLNENMVVTRSPGRGTFVQRPRVTKNQQLTSFTEDMHARGIPASTRLVRLDEVTSTTEQSREFGLGPGAALVRAERLRYGAEEAICHETVYLPPQLASALSASDYEQSIHAALRSQGAAPVSATRHTSAALFPRKVAALLGSSADAPALRVKHTFRDSKAEPLYLADSFYRADRYEIVTEVERFD